MPLISRKEVGEVTWYLVTLAILLCTINSAFLFLKLWEERGLACKKVSESIGRRIAINVMAKIR